MCLDTCDISFETFQQRLNSFKNWKNPNVKIEDLSKNGFYFLKDFDFVKCFYCDIILGNWQKGVNVSSEHFKFSPTCKVFSEYYKIDPDLKCKICLNNYIEIINFPCGHLCLCESCSKVDFCPYCGIKIKKHFNAVVIPELMYYKSSSIFDK